MKMMKMMKMSDIVILRVVKYKVPSKGDSYINKIGRVDTCTEQNYSRRAQKRLVVQIDKEEFRYIKSLMKELNKK